MNRLTSSLYLPFHSAHLQKEGQGEGIDGITYPSHKPEERIMEAFIIQVTKVGGPLFEKT